MSNAQGFVAPFQISHPPISGLLNMHTMQIPDLQRYYAWTELEARELCADLERLLESVVAGRHKPQHFFGSLVVVYHAGGRDDIVDGQQRMTTVTLLLGQIHCALVRLANTCRQIAIDNAVNQTVASHHQNVATSVDMTASQVRNMLFVNTGLAPDGSSIWEPRLKVTPEITETYLATLEGRDNNVPSEQLAPAVNLRKVARVFEDRLVEPMDYMQLQPVDQHAHLQRLLGVVSDGLIVVRLGTDHAESAYELFESLNARGVPLNALDHLKVWMLSVYAQNQLNSSDIAKKMRALSNDDREKQVAFFEDFYEARSLDNREYDGLNAPKKLVAASRRKVFHDPTQNSAPDVMGLTARIQHEVDYMTDLYPIWSKLKQNVGNDPFLPPSFGGYAQKDWVTNRLELLLSVLKHQKAYPYLMVAANRLSQQPDVFDDLIHLIERFFFRYKTICGGNESSIREMYNQLLTDLDANPGFNIVNVQNKMRVLIGQKAPDREFRAKLVEKLGYGNASQNARTKYFFETIESYQHVAKPFKNVPRLNLSQWHLEHIVPQRPKPNDPSLPEDKVDSIGNLCLLPPEINTKLSNRSYAEKQLEAKRLQNLPGAQQINIRVTDSSKIFYQGSGPVWSSTDVDQRIEYLLHFACQIFAI